jgi:hypothetical protein
MRAIRFETQVIAYVIKLVEEPTTQLRPQDRLVRGHRYMER